MLRSRGRGDNNGTLRAAHDRHGARVNPACTSLDACTAVRATVGQDWRNEIKEKKDRNKGRRHRSGTRRAGRASVPTPEKMLGKAGRGRSAAGGRGVGRELLDPERCQRCRNLEGHTTKGRAWRESLAVRRVRRILPELTIKARRSIRTWLRARRRRTSCCSRSCASFRCFRNYPRDEGRAGGAHPRPIRGPSAVEGTPRVGGLPRACCCRSEPSEL